jgi:hypothetical protein
MLFSEAVAANRAAIMATTVPQLRRLLPLLKRAERETARGLGQWLAAADPGARYDKHKHRALVGQLRSAIALVQKRVAPALSDDITTQGKSTRAVGLGQLEQMIEAGQARFKGAVSPLRLDVAAMMTDEHRMMIGQVESSAARYAGAVGGDIQNRLMLGVIRGETVDQLTSRLLASTGLIRVFKAMGPMRVAEGAAANIFNSYRSNADGIARTELVNAYAAVQARAIGEADKEDPGYLMRWDAANDWRLCAWCHALDEVTVKPGEMFSRRGSRSSPRPHPPLHPRCRCAIVPWRPGWTYN